jgi:hypothetical protein
MTAAVVTWKVAVVAPAATVTVAGTVAAALLLASVTEAAAAAAPLNVTVPVGAVPTPPVTVVGFKVTDVIAGFTITVRLAVAVWGVGVAESVTVTVNENVPKAVGVPDNTPAELTAIPVGSAPPVTVHV